MAYLIGTDEAGYGPNLGPLVITASVWRVDSIDSTDLFSRLLPAVLPPGTPESHNAIMIGDSKELYKPGKGLGGLEQGIFPCLAAMGKSPGTWRQIWNCLAAEDSKQIADLPWYCDYDQGLPLQIQKDTTKHHCNQLLAACESGDCMPTQMRSRVIVPPVFNKLCRQFGNKASALSQATLRLVRSLLQELPDDEPVFVLCDKHGGRNKYGPLLNEILPETLAIVRHEGRNESAYRLGDGHQRREIVFRAKADQCFLPSGLASMVSKYLRELAMRAFNDYWHSQIQDLKPTAGYPQDAKRFKREIETMQKQLEISDDDLWRCR